MPRTPSIAGADLDALRERIGDQWVRFTFSRSGGPGGQNVNKVSTRATLWFDLGGCDALTFEEKERIRRRLGGRISGEGILHVMSSRHRTQGANRDAAKTRLFELLAGALRTPKTRKPTTVPKAARQRRLREKRKLSERKQMRGRPARE